VNNYLLPLLQDESNEYPTKTSLDSEIQVEEFLPLIFVTFSMFIFLIHCMYRVNFLPYLQGICPIYELFAGVGRGRGPRTFSNLDLDFVDLGSRNLGLGPRHEPHRFSMPQTGSGKTISIKKVINIFKAKS